MSTTTQNAAIIAPHFIKFEVQRAIRIVHENGEHCRAIDTRQDETILAPIMLDEDLHDPALYLMESEIAGELFAFVARHDDGHYQLAGTLEAGDYSLTHSVATYGGVVWRVLGYLSDMPNDAMQLWAGNDEAGVRQTCAAFQAMKDAFDNIAAGAYQTDQTQSVAEGPAEAQKPVQVVVDISGGCIHGVYAKVPVDIVFLSHDKHDLDEYQLEQGYLSMDNKPVALFRNHVEGEGQPEVVGHYFAEHAKTAPGAAEEQNQNEEWPEISHNGQRWSFGPDELAQWDEEGQEFHFHSYHRLAEPTADTVKAYIDQLARV